MRKENVMRTLTRSIVAIKRTAPLLCVAVVLLLLVASAAGAATPPLLTKTPEDGGPGSGAGAMNNPIGIASNPTDGDIYVSEASNNRVSEFTAWGTFVEAFGWGVVNGTAEPQVCTDTCQAGIAGSGAGQVNQPGSIVSDATGDVYVVDKKNLRIEKFSPTGEFLLTFGYHVNKTTGADVCTAAEVAGGDECGPGQTGTEIGQFGNWNSLFSGPRTTPPAAISSSGDVYVGDYERIQVFDPDGAFIEAIDFSEVPGLPAVEAYAQAITVTPDGTVDLALTRYNTSGEEIADVWEVDPATRQLLGKISVPVPRLLGTDQAGNLYVVSYMQTTEHEEGAREEVLVFNSSGECSTACPGSKFAATEPFFEATISSIATGSACGPTDVYLGTGGPEYLEPMAIYPSQVWIYGSPPDPASCPPPVAPPTIDDQFASAVQSETATVDATINPHFWPDTTFYVEYGTEACATGSCSAQSRTSLGGQVVSAPVKTTAVLLHGLQPGTTYHYRFVSESGGGGPVFGPDSTFTTYPTLTHTLDTCPNAAFRLGVAATLPDCRAFEMVSPVDKEGGDIDALTNVFGYPARLNQSDLAGQKLTYSAARNFGGALSGAYMGQYMASRTETGWTTEAITPPGNGPVYERNLSTDTEFKAFSADLCEAWLRHFSGLPLAAGAPAGFPSLYRRDNCAEAKYQALPIPPPSEAGSEYEPQLQGVSANGEVAIFAANESLTADAPPVANAFAELELYESRPGQEPKFVCILPNGKAVTHGCSAGTFNSFGGGYSGGTGRAADLQGAISEDGSRIFWSNPSTAGGKVREGEGRLFLRLEGDETIPVSAFAEGKSKTIASQFWAASADGSRVIFTSGEDLWEYDVESGVSNKIAGKVSGLMGVSKDAGHVYFVSEEALSGGAVAGKHNLYLSVLTGEEHRVVFITEVSATDAEAGTHGLVPSPTNLEPTKHDAHVTPSGEVLAFISTGSPTGFDNIDANSGKADAEVYVYEARSGELHCVSCNRTGARPQGKELEPVAGSFSGPPSAAVLPTWETSLYEPRVLSSDGDRLFFESYDPLVPSDTNNQLDLYQWEAAGTGGCREGQGSWVPAAGGCIDMISSGQSSYPSEFVDATPDGSNVYFSTLSSLVPQDYGHLDIYDARVEGGFPPPPQPPQDCEGSTCQSPPPAPAPSSSASQNFQGPGNAPPSKKTSCPKGKHLQKKGGKQRCVAKKSSANKKKHHRVAKKGHHKAKQSNKSRRAGR